MRYFIIIYSITLLSLGNVLFIHTHSHEHADEHIENHHNCIECVNINNNSLFTYFIKTLSPLQYENIKYSLTPIAFIDSDYINNFQSRAPPATS